MAGVRGCLAIVAVLVLGGVGLAEEYEVGPGDTLRIEVVSRPEMTDNFVVDSAGMINYWEVGRVKASGYTTKSLASKLTTLLVEGRFMRRPQVRVQVAEYGSQKVYVAGEVQRQGYYALKADRALRGVMSDIPLTPNAGHEVIVIRPGARAQLLTEPAPGDEASCGGCGLASQRRRRGQRGGGAGLVGRRRGRTPRRWPLRRRS